MSIDKTLAEREGTHGDFNKVAETAQRLKEVLSDACRLRSPAHREAVDLICTKLARIHCGDAWEPDHWRDIQGYAKLAEDRCVEQEAPTHSAGNMTLEQAQEEIRFGRCKRIVMPGEWRVWREDGVVRTEVFGVEKKPVVAGEWIEWGGGRTPAYLTTEVEVRFRNGETCMGEAFNYHWDHRGGAMDVVAYRILPEQFAN
jgi:hypothetical protein